MLFGVQISIQVLGQEIPFEKENSARCRGDKVEPALEAEPTVEVVPQDLPLQNTSSAPGELLSHGVKEESDMEPELGEGKLSVVLCLGEIWGLWRIWLSVCRNSIVPWKVWKDQTVF